ncbi:MAG TPA: phasin family protein [Rhizobiaceae bacterium]|nr:phasin family protein [Rhizobiaceae bacterium]
MIQNLESFTKQGQENFDTALKTVNAMTKGFQEIAKEAADFSKKQFETSAATAEKLMATKSVEKAFEVQADYMKGSYEAFVAQATRMGELYSDMAKQAYKPYEAFAPKSAK